MIALCAGPSWDGWLCSCQEKVQAGYQNLCLLGSPPAHCSSGKGLSTWLERAAARSLPCLPREEATVQLYTNDCQCNHFIIWSRERGRNQACVYYILCQNWQWYWVMREMSLYNISWVKRKLHPRTWRWFGKCLKTTPSCLWAVQPASCLGFISITCNKRSGCCSLHGVFTLTHCIMQTMKKPLHE